MSAILKDPRAATDRVPSDNAGTEIVTGYRSFVRAMFLAALVVCAAWFTREGTYYTPGSTVGYNLGLVGAVFMLILMFYPLVKRIRLMRESFSARYWFRAHMLFGVGGPVLILFHSTLQVRSFNGAVVFFCMLLVFMSGLFGRFVYPRVMHKLYERRAKLASIKQELGIAGEDAHSKFRAVPQVEARLLRLESSVLETASTLPGSLWLLPTLRLRLLWHYFRAHREMKKVFKTHVRAKRWDRRKLRHKSKLGKRMIRAHLCAVKDTAKLSRYERLSSFWRVIHIPMNFLLVITGIVHVLAVHMY